MSFSTLPILFLLQALGMLIAARCFNPTATKTMVALVGMLSAWGVISGYLAFARIYQGDGFLNAWPSLWITFVPVALLAGPMLLLAKVRLRILDLVRATPDHWFVAIQCLRMLAVGGVAKAFGGEFALYYGLYVGIPDMIYGLSGIGMLWLLHMGYLSKSLLISWHLAGAAIIVPFGLVLLQLGLPGTWHVFTEKPDITTIFAFPMALAPTLVVPIFVILNLFAALKLLVLVENDQVLPCWRIIRS